MADFQRRLTVQEIISRVMGSFGLPTPASVYASHDGNVTQMLSLLNDVGEELLTKGDWQFLDREHTITTTTSLVYDLPTDLSHYTADSQWNQSSKLPLTGPVTERNWQAIKARGLGGGTLTLYFRVTEDQIEFMHSPGEGKTITLPYKSRAWVRAADNTLRDNIQAGDDVVLYDPVLIRAALTLAWVKRKGFDTKSAKEDFDLAMESAGTKNDPGQTLSLVPSSGVALLGTANVPITGYGSS